MSHFVCTAIEVSENGSQFRARGGDNNIVPRFDRWSDWLEIDLLFQYYKRGTLKLARVNEVDSGLKARLRRLKRSVLV